MPTKKKAKAPVEDLETKTRPNGENTFRGIRRFVLRRLEDASGISGTGIVAEGAEFSCGWVALTWLRAYQAYTWLPSIAAVVAIHGHSGKTVVEFEDDQPKEH